MLVARRLVTGAVVTPHEIKVRYRLSVASGAILAVTYTIFGLYWAIPMSPQPDFQMTTVAVVVAVGIAIFAMALTFAHWLFRRMKHDLQQIVEEEDADLALVNKIARAVRPSLASTFFVNSLFFILGLVAAAYTPEVRNTLDKLFGD